MGVTVNWWDKNEDILHYQFKDPWTWNDYQQALAQGRAMMREKSHYVGILNNLLETKHFPGLIVSKMKKYIETRPANTGLAVFVSESFFIYTIYHTFNAIYPRLSRGYILASTEEEAVAQIKAWLAKQGPLSEAGRPYAPSK